MPKRIRDRSISFRVTEDEYASIQKRAKFCGLKQSEYIIQRTLADAIEKPISADQKHSECSLISGSEVAAWRDSVADRMQLLRRMSVLMRMVKLIISKQMEYTDEDINKLLLEYIKAAKEEFPNKVDHFSGDLNS